jgi:deoxyadenosine/deoxycytidine kinase
VIDTVNFKRWALDDYYYTNPQEYRMHSDAFHTIERLRWKSKDALSYALTIDDPKIFSAPWTQEFEILSKPEWDKDGLFEYVCEENNRCAGGKCGDGK